MLLSFILTVMKTKKFEVIYQVVFGCLIFFFFIGCTDHENGIDTLKITRKIELKLIYSGDVSTYFWKWHRAKNGKEFLAYYNITKNRIECYDLHENQLLDSISVETEGPNGILMIDFFMDDKNIIQVGKRKILKYSLVDKNVKKWSFDSLNLWMNSNYQFLSNFYNPTDRTIFSNIGIGGEFVILNDQKNEIEVVSYQRPEGVNFYKKIDGLPTLNDFVSPYFSVTEKYVFLDFPFTSDLFYTEPNTPHILKQKETPINKLNIPYSNISYGNLYDEILHASTWFGPTKWDPFSERFYRMAVSGKVKSIDSSRRGFILVFDEELNFERLVRLPSEVKFNQFFITDKGLLFKDKNQPNEEKVSFSYLSF